MTFPIGNVVVGGDNPCRFIFEVSNAHNGSLERAHRLIDAAKASGADFVKLQAYTPSELCDLRGDGPAPEPWGSAGWTMRSLYEKAQTPLAWLPELFQHARDIDIVPFASVFGLDSLSALEKCACPAYKISHFEARSDALLGAVASRGKTMLVSHSDIKDLWPERNSTALYCPGSYPCSVDELKLPLFSERGVIGLSSHCLDPMAPVVAVARGCKIIEMHGMLDDEASELEANVSLTQSQFAEMIRRVRDVEAMIA